MNLIPKQEIIWYKNAFNLGRQDYQWIHEPCFYGWKEGASHYFVGDRNISTVMDLAKSNDINSMTKDELIDTLYTILNMPTTVIQEKKPLKDDLHPTMKPVKLIAQLIRNSSKRGWNVIDLFGGSGTTLIACEQLERKCFMMEYDLKFADRIVKRYFDLTKRDDIHLLRNGKEIKREEYKDIFK